MKSLSERQREKILGKFCERERVGGKNLFTVGGKVISDFS